MFWGLIVVAVVAFIGVLVFKNNPNQAVAKGGAGVSVLVLLAAVVGIAVTEMGSGRSVSNVVNVVENSRRVLAYGVAEKFKNQDNVAFFTCSEDGGGNLTAERRQIYDYLIKYGIPESEITIVGGFPADVLKSDPKALGTALKAQSAAKTIVLFGFVPTSAVKNVVSKNTGNQQEVFWLFENNSTVPDGAKAIMGKTPQSANNTFSGDDATDFAELFVIK